MTGSNNDSSNTAPDSLPTDRAIWRSKRAQEEEERKETYRDALVGRRVVVKYDDDLEEFKEYTGVVACRALGIKAKEKYYMLWDSEPVDGSGQWQVNDNPETLKGASYLNWPTIGTYGDWWVLPVE